MYDPLYEFLLFDHANNNPMYNKQKENLHKKGQYNNLNLKLPEFKSVKKVSFNETLKNFKVFEISFP